MSINGLFSTNPYNLNASTFTCPVVNSQVVSVSNSASPSVLQYSLPVASPAGFASYKLAFDAGTKALTFVDGAAVSSNALTNSDILDTPVLGSLPVFTGLNPFETTPNNTLNIDSDLVTLNDGSLVFSNTAGVSGNTSTVEQLSNGQFSLNNNCLEGAMSFGCGGDMAFNTPNRIFLTGDGGTIVKSSLVVSDTGVASTSFNQLGTSFNLINNAVSGSVNLLTDGRVRLSSSSADIVLQSPNGTSVQNSLTLVGASGDVNFGTAGGNLEITNAVASINLNATSGTQVRNGLELFGASSYAQFSVNSSEDLDITNNSTTGGVNLGCVGDMSLTATGLGSSLTASSAGNINLNSGLGAVSVVCPQDINMTSSAGSFFVNSGSQFNGQMTTQDVQINGGYSLLLHDSTTGENGTLSEDTNGFLNINNRYNMNLTTTEAGAYFKLQTGTGGFLEINNSGVSNSGYIGVEEPSGDFQIYSNNNLNLTVDDPASYIITTNNNGVVNKVQNCQGGAGAGTRPASPVLGECFFDTSLGYPIWYSGVIWVNSNGGGV
jgi:hypothetical protein